MAHSDSESARLDDPLIPGGTGTGVVFALKVLINLSGGLAVLGAVGLAGLLLRSLGVQLSAFALGPARGLAQGSTGASGVNEFASLPPGLEAYFSAVPAVFWMIGLLFVVASLLVLRCMLNLIERSAAEQI